MLDLHDWLFGCVIGCVASFLYFWGLWVTVRRLGEVPSPLALYATSLVLRLALLGVAFVIVLNGGWQQVVPAVITWGIVRYLLVRPFTTQGETTLQRLTP